MDAGTGDTAGMLEHRLGAVAEVLGVSVDTVRRWIDQGLVAGRRTAGGQRLVDGADLARFLRESPDDTLPGWAQHQSARNRFAGIVTEVRSDGAGVAATVELRCGPHRLVSLLTAEAVAALDLRPGVLAVAAVKATNVVVEIAP